MSDCVGCKRCVSLIVLRTRICFRNLETHASAEQDWTMGKFYYIRTHVLRIIGPSELEAFDPTTGLANNPDRTRGYTPNHRKGRVLGSCQNPENPGLNMGGPGVSFFGCGVPEHDLLEVPETRWVP